MKAAQDGTKLFQSTLPVRGATCLVRPFSNRWIAISIHAPRAGSDVTNYFSDEPYKISIHAPRAGSDQAADLGYIQ